MLGEREEKKHRRCRQSQKQGDTEWVERLEQRSGAGPVGQGGVARGAKKTHTAVTTTSGRFTHMIDCQPSVPTNNPPRVGPSATTD